MDGQIKLVWSGQIPSDEGFYWIELSGGIRIIAELNRVENGLIFNWMNREFTVDKISRYCGPIPEPVMDKAEGI